MTLQDFDYLTFIEKLNVVKEFGEFADNFRSKTENIRCFSVHKFFVEIVYDTEMTNIIDIRGFESGISLDKYVINFNNCNNRF
jgi:hypothetical protein